MGKALVGQILKRAQTLNENIARQNDRMENLQDLMLDEKLSLSDYTNMKQRIEKDNTMMEIELEEIRSVKSNWEKFLSKGVHLLADLKGYYRKSDLKQKKQLLSSIFPDKLQILKNKGRTIRAHEALRSRCR